MPDISEYESFIAEVESGTYATLGLRIGSQAVTPGAKVPKAETRSTPTIYAPKTAAPPLQPGQYTIIAIDVDAPYTSWNSLSPIVHWIQTGFVVPEPEPDQSQDASAAAAASASPEQSLQEIELKSTDPITVPWLPAGPPPGTAPHRYVFMLYMQTPGAGVPEPRKLKGRPRSRLGRMRFDVKGMVGELGLGEVVAGNYFVCN
ncbi:phosphatidylethanolamine-binding protein [Aspergillus carlsbadensis]|nr:phosphatidylethanolamine-binding protein [Aspergillus carlsbadensis]